MKLSELAAKIGLTHAEAAFCVADGLAIQSTKGSPLKLEEGDYLTESHGLHTFLREYAPSLARHPDFQDVIDTAEAARRCGCGASTIRRWLKDGEIKPVRKARPLARIGKNGGSQTYYWKHGDIAVAALRHGVYKPGEP